MKNKLLTTIVLAGLTLPVITNPKDSNWLNLQKTNFPKENIIEIPKTLPRLKKTKIEDFEKSKYLKRERIRSIIDSIYKHTKTILSKKELEVIAFKESSFNAHAKNISGAKGIYQLKEGAWKDSGIGIEYSQNVFKPEKNIQAGIKYYSWLEKTISKNDSTWKNSTRIEKRNKLLAAYNWGYGNMKKNNWKIPSFVKETRNYIRYIDKNSKKDI